MVSLGLIALLVIVILFFWLESYMNQYGVEWANGQKLKLRANTLLDHPSFEVEGGSFIRPYDVLVTSDENIRNIVRYGYTITRTNTKLTYTHHPLGNVRLICINYNKVQLESTYTYIGYNINTAIYEKMLEIKDVIEQLNIHETTYQSPSVNRQPLDHDTNESPIPGEVIDPINARSTLAVVDEKPLETIYPSPLIVYGEGINGNIALALLSLNIPNMAVVVCNIYKETDTVAFIRYLETRSKYYKYAILTGPNSYVRDLALGTNGSNGTREGRYLPNVIVTEYNDVFDASYIDTDSWMLNNIDYIGYSSFLTVGDAQVAKVSAKYPNFTEVFHEIQMAVQIYNATIRTKITTLYVGEYYFMFVDANDIIPILPYRSKIVILGGFELAWLAIKMYNKLNLAGYDCKAILFGTDIQVSSRDDNIIVKPIYERLQMYDIAINALLNEGSTDAK